MQNVKKKWVLSAATACTCLLIAGVGTYAYSNGAKSKIPVLADYELKSDGVFVYSEDGTSTVRLDAADFTKLANYSNDMDLTVMEAIAPVYTPGASYNAGDIVVYKYRLYKCKAALDNAPTELPESSFAASNVQDALSDTSRLMKLLGLQEYDPSHRHGYDENTYIVYENHIWKTEQALPEGTAPSDANSTSSSIIELVSEIKEIVSQGEGTVFVESWDDTNKILKLDSAKPGVPATP